MHATRTHHVLAPLLLIASCTVHGSMVIRNQTSLPCQVCIANHLSGREMSLKNVFQDGIHDRFQLDALQSKRTTKCTAPFVVLVGCGQQVVRNAPERPCTIAEKDPGRLGTWRTVCTSMTPRHSYIVVPENSIINLREQEHIRMNDTTMLLPPEHELSQTDRTYFEERLPHRLRNQSVVRLAQELCYEHEHRSKPFEPRARGDQIIDILGAPATLSIEEVRVHKTNVVLAALQSLTCCRTADVYPIQDDA